MGYHRMDKQGKAIWTKMKFNNSQMTSCLCPGDCGFPREMLKIFTFNVANLSGERFQCQKFEQHAVKLMRISDFFCIELKNHQIEQKWKLQVDCQCNVTRRVKRQILSTTNKLLVKITDFVPPQPLSEPFPGKTLFYLLEDAQWSTEGLAVSSLLVLVQSGAIIAHNCMREGAFPLYKPTCEQLAKVT